MVLKTKDYVLEYEESRYPIWGLIVGIIGLIIAASLLRHLEILSIGGDVDFLTAMGVLGYLAAAVLSAILIYTGIHELIKYDIYMRGEKNINKFYFSTEKIISIKQIINPESPNHKPKPIKYKELKIG